MVRDFCYRGGNGKKTTTIEITALAFVSLTEREMRYRGRSSTGWYIP